MRRTRTLRNPSRSRPRLRFTPRAWSKLLFLRDRGPTEVGGFGISAADDPLLVEEFVLVRQRCTPMTVQFDDEAVADHFDRQVDRGLAPERFARIWIHTHPDGSATPSGVDERTFAASFSGPDWGVMLILARGGATYARMRFNTGPGAEVRLAVGVDFTAPFAGSDQAAWAEEYDQCVWTDALASDLPTWQDLLLGDELLATEHSAAYPDSSTSTEVSYRRRNFIAD